MKRMLFLLFTVLLLAGCQKDPDLSDLSDDFVVFTDYDPEVSFTSYSTFYLPDSILLITDNPTPRYWSDERAKEIISNIETVLTTRGYTRVDEKENADIGIQPSYIQGVSYFYGYSNPYWWWGYPGYWGPGYWGGGWYGYYYPYPVTYSYKVGSMMMEMVDLTVKPEEGEKNPKLPIRWTAYMDGILSGSSRYNAHLIVRAVNQAFEQSPYIKK